MNKDRFKKEVESLLSSNKNLNKDDFEKLFKFATDTKGDSKSKFCDDLIKKMFGTVYKEEFIPWSFFDTEVGKAIISVKYGQDPGIFFVREIAEFMGKSRQYINQEIKSGNLKAYKRCGNSIVYRGDLEDYLEKRDINKEILYKEMEEEIIIPNDEREEKYGE